MYVVGIVQIFWSFVMIILFVIIIIFNILYLEKGFLILYDFGKFYGFDGIRFCLTTENSLKGR